MSAGPFYLWTLPGRLWIFVAMTGAQMPCVDRTERLLPSMCSDFNGGNEDASDHQDHTSPGLPHIGITGIVLACVIAMLCIAATVGEQIRQT